MPWWTAQRAVGSAPSDASRSRSSSGALGARSSASACSRGIGIADIADRSGVHAASIYRRWGTVQALLLDMTVARISHQSPMPDTGSLEGDLLAWGLRLARSVSGPEVPV